MDFQTVLASAGVSAIVSSIITLVGKWQDRRQQAKVMLFDLAFRIAKERTELILKAADKSGGSASLRDDVFQAADYYKWIKHLFDKDVLPAEAIALDKKNEAALKAK